MFKKTAILLFTAVSFIFASGSIERSRFLDTDFIDIGTKNGIAENVIAQQFMNIPAKTKLLDEILDFKPRKYETYKCQVDDEGGETCPKDVTACTADPQYSAGTSEKKSGVYTLSAPYAMGWINKKQSTTGHFGADHWIDAFFTWYKQSKTLQMFIYGSNPGRGMVEWNVGNINNATTLLSLVNPSIKDGKVYISMKFWGDRCSSNSAEYVLEIDKLYKTNKVFSKQEMISFAEQTGIMSPYIRHGRISKRTYHAAAKSSVMYGHILSLGLCGGKGAQSPYVLFEEKGELGPICPSDFSFSKEKDHCVKIIDYTYYDYKCPPNTGEINPETGRPYPDWQGPYDKGGDCGGAGINANKECNSATPPSKNCFRNDFFCPFDKKHQCFKKPTEEKPVAENQKDDYIYTMGIPDTITNKLTSDPICENGGAFVEEKKQCQIEAKAKCPTGFIQSPYDDMCVKKLTERCVQTDENGQCIKKEFENCQGDFVESEKPGDSNLCFVTKEQECPNGYIGDLQTKCIKQAQCPDHHILTPEGKCELVYFYTNYTCPAGYENVRPTNSSNDCKGLCGSDGCSCNSAIPSADNCRKKVTTKNTNTYEVSKKSPMIVHKVTPSIDHKIPDENFNVTNVPCNYEINATKTGICKDNVNSIIGQDERLCFKKGNGQEFCYNIAGCRFSGKITSDKITDLFIERDLKTISSKSATGSIKSTCQLNGNVGYSPRNEGITSVSPKLGSQKYVTIKAKGNAKTSNGTWSGFNIATMAVQLSDGLWYTLDEAYDDEGKRISRNVPDFVIGLNRTFFKIGKKSEECEVKGVKVTAYCGEEIALYMPNPNLGVIGVAELDSLDDDKDKSSNAVNLNILINGIKMPLTKSINTIDNNPFVVKPISPITEYSDRLNFWDSYMDGDIGFIEFVREVSSNDRNEGFVPENKIPYEMGDKGFTNIEYSSADEKTEEYVQGKVEILRRQVQTVTKEVEKLAVEQLFWSHNSRRMESYRYAEFVRKICNRDFHHLTFGADFYLAKGMKDRNPYTGPIKDVITINNNLVTSRTDVPGYSKADVYEINGVIDKTIFLYNDTRQIWGGKDERKELSAVSTFYDFFEQGRTHYSRTYGGNHPRGSSGTLLLAQCYRKDSVSENVCPGAYELKELDGKPICEKKAVSCPTGYFYTGKDGKEACRKALISGTFFVSSKMNEKECQENSTFLNGTIIPFEMLKFTLINYGKSLLHSGATKEGCVIRVNHQTDFQSNIYAAKTLTYNNNFEYVCSKWSCAGGSCKIGICPTFNTTIGKENKPMEYQGKIIPKDLEGKLSQEACLEQECDANKEHAGVCGLKFQPSTSLSKGVFFQDGKFYQAYCDEKDAVLSDDGATCIVKRCPEGTIKQANGTCKKK